MPQLRGITVRVTDAEGNELEEWAVQHLRKQPKVSAYIKAQSNMPFRVTVQAQIPYTDYELPCEVGVTDNTYQDQNSEHTNRAGNRKPRKDAASRSLRMRHGSQARVSQENGPAKASTVALSSLVYKQSRFPESPPFDFLAALYLDGRSKAERRVIVYLNPKHEDFNPGGKSCLKCRWVQTKDGGMKEYAWVFNDIGIDTILDKLALSTAGQDTGDDEIAIIAAMKGAGISPETDIFREERKKVGQIEVKISRVILRKKYTVDQYQSRHREGENEDVAMDGTASDLTHSTGFTPMNAARSEFVPVVEYTLYDKKEDVYATFKFFYRSQQTLERLIPSYPRMPNSVKQRNSINIDFAAKTPLSISHGSKPKPTQAPLAVTAFEDRLKQQTLESNCAIEFNFDDRNRRIELNPVKDERAAKIKELRRSSRSHATFQQDYSTTEDQESHGVEKTVTVNVIDLTQPEASKTLEAVTEARGPSLMQRLAPSSEEDTGISRASQARSLSKKTLNLHKSRSAAPPDAREGFSGSAEASAEASDGTTSKDSLAEISSNHREPSLSLGNGDPKEKTAISQHLAPPTKLMGKAYRYDFSSDADDEHDAGESDLETEIGEDEKHFADDVLPSQNRDDEGLHQRLREITIKGRGKRLYGEEYSLQEGGSEDEEYQSYQNEQSSINDAGDELQQAETKQKNKHTKTTGQEVNELEQQNKRFKKDA